MTASIVDLAGSGRKGAGYSARGIAIASGVGAAALVVLAIAVAVVVPIDLSQIWAEVFRSLLTLASALIIAGGVSAAVDVAHRQREQREHDRIERLALAHRVRNVQSSVKRAALLIDAHRTARTYGEQMRALLDTRVEVGNIRFAADNLTCVSDDARQDLVRFIGRATTYIQGLTEEYRDEYLRVSAIQRATSAWENAQANALATHVDPPSPDRIVTTTVPWDALTNKATFPRLAILLESLDENERWDSPHQTEFSVPIKNAVGTLLEGKASKGASPTPTTRSMSVGSAGASVARR